MKRILVIGGTRFFGRLIVAALAAAGHRVTVMTRGNKAVEFAGIEALACDRKDRAALADALAGREFDAVIDNICYQPEDAQTILGLLTGRCGRYVLTSSVMSYLDALADGKPVGEENWGVATAERLCPPYAPAEIGYAQGKRGCELAALARTDLSPVIFRLHNVVGEDDFSGKSGAFAGALRLRPAASDRYQFVHAADLAPLYLEALDAPAGAYNVAAESISVGEVMALAGCAPVSLGEADAPQGPYPHNITLDAGLLRRTFTTRLTPPAEFLPAVFSWYAS